MNQPPFNKSCLFCGKVISPHVYSSGKTRHLDHFIPLSIIALIKHFRPKIFINNALLPCCIRCNNFAGSYLFWSVCDKRDYVQSKTGIIYNANDSLLTIFLPLELTQMFLSGDYLQTDEFELIWAMTRDPVTNRWRRDELVITRATCNSVTHSMGLLKTAS